MAIATLLALLIAYQNLPAIQRRAPDIGLGVLFLQELLLWYSWVIVLPILYAVGVRFPLAGAQRWRNLFVHVLVAPLVVLVVVVMFAASRSVLLDDSGGFSIDAVLSILRRSFAFFLFIYAALLALVQASYQSRQRHLQLTRHAELQRILHEAQLSSLRAQLDPHFLFNALNAISSLIERQPAEARDTIARLSVLLRRSLEHAQTGTIMLAEELELLDIYLDIQRLRFGERLDVAVSVVREAYEAEVPRFVLQPLVENAIIHGIDGRADAKRVDVQITVAGGILRIAVSDDGPGFPSHVRERVGLGNTRARLALHYADAASLTLQERPGGGALAMVELPLQLQDAAAGPRPAPVDRLR